MLHATQQFSFYWEQHSSWVVIKIRFPWILKKYDDRRRHQAPVRILFPLSMPTKMTSSCILSFAPLGFQLVALTVADSNPISSKSLKTLTHTIILKALLVRWSCIFHAKVVLPIPLAHRMVTTMLSVCQINLIFSLSTSPTVSSSTIRNHFFREFKIFH